MVVVNRAPVMKVRSLTYMKMGDAMHADWTDSNQP